MSKKYYIAMPNVSNGLNPEIYEPIIQAARNIPDVTVVNCEIDPDFNRSVINLIGEEEALKKACIEIARKCVELIDLRTHKGTHPRMGALDTLSIYPFKNSTIEDSAKFIADVGQRMFQELKIPIFFSGANASSPAREDHMTLRGQYEVVYPLLKELKADPTRAQEYENKKPDLSIDGLLDEKFGGAELYTLNTIPSFHNIYLSTENLSIAKAIAKAVRSKTGGFSTVTAIGVKLKEHEGVCVSLNITDTSKTPIYRPFEFVKREAESYGVTIIGSELVGVVRLDPIVECAKRLLQLENFNTQHIMESHLF